jgi:ribonuclease HII
MIKYKIGIDEVGRGPVAGPVAVCATLIEIKNEAYLKKELEGMTDSKKLTEKRREKLFLKVKELKDCHMIFSSVVFVSAKDIDKIGIVPSIQKALDRALLNIFKNEKTKEIKLDDVKVLLDGGLKAPNKYQNQESIIKGDEKEFVISVASVTAKVLRDRKMKEYGNQFPQYFFEKHKGYGTKAHMEAIKKHGFSPLHRKTFLKKFF